MFLNGFLLASMFYFKMQASYEDGLFSSIENSIDATVNADDTQDSVVLKAMNVCNYLMKNRVQPQLWGRELRGSESRRTFFIPLP